MLLDRRQFFHTLPAMAPVTSAAPDTTAAKTRLYSVEQIYLENGSQVGRVHEFLSKGLLPALKPLMGGPKIVLEALVAPHMPQVTLILGFSSCDEIWSMGAKLWTNRDFLASVDQWEAGEAPYQHYSASLLEATNYSPEIVPLPKAPAAPRVFELRTYHSPTIRQLKALHERFAGPEIKIFHRVGVHPILYSSTLFGQKRPNLTYLTPFDSLAAREKAWAAFGADEEWLKVRKESIDRSGQISSVIDIALYRATAYSPVQ